MSSITLAKRAPRSTRAVLADADSHQVQVIARLIASGDTHIAARLMCCLSERQNRGNSWPWRCRSAGCWSCRRTLMRNWWRGMLAWGPQGQAWTSLAVIPLPIDRIAGIRALRRGLRDVRDRRARLDARWRSVAFTGMLSNHVALLLVSHPDVDRSLVWWTLAARRSDTMLTDIGNAEPSWDTSVNDAATLARCRRGIQPIRIVIPPQQVAATSPKDWDEPMPVCF
jgi:hypothetical protein